MKTPDQLRAEAAAAAKADMAALGRHNTDGTECMCGQCAELLGQQYRWNYERLERESNPIKQMLANAAPVALPIAGPVPVQLVQPLPPHIHDIDPHSSVPYCRSCGQVVQAQPDVLIVGHNG